jgi:hypothetical protein
MRPWRPPSDRAHGSRTCTPCLGRAPYAKSGTIIRISGATRRGREENHVSVRTLQGFDRTPERRRNAVSWGYCHRICTTTIITYENLESLSAPLQQINAHDRRSQGHARCPRKAFIYPAKALPNSCYCKSGGVTPPLAELPNRPRFIADHVD